MIQHFNNLQTPLKVIHTYPRLEDQEQRFSDAGWFSASARSLWGIWLDPAFLSREQRIAIDNVEPFDEWEEFVLFASHYFLLTANSKGSMQNLGHDTSRVLRRCRSDDEEASSAPILIRRDTYKSSKRRFGALVNLAPGIVGHHGGLGAQSRLDSMDLYAISNALPTLAGGVPSISPRMCHSITAFGESSLLVGGRTSPKHPLEDCWLFRRSRWTRVDDLPIPLFRHCAAEVVLEGDKVLRGILINGGKTSRNQISDRWLLWSEDHGWTRVTCRQCHFAARFGAAIVSTSGSRGILIGGMGADGTIFEELWEWKLEMTKNSPSIELKRCEHLMLHDAGAMLRSPANRSNAVGRMGACLVRSAANILLIGGVHSSVLAADHDIAALSQDAAESNYWQISPVKFRRSDDQCLFVGHSAALTTSGCIALVGGGAMCFSFGTHWNTSIITLSTRGTEAFSAKVDELPNSLSSSSSPDESREQSNDIQIEPPLNKVTRVERYHLKSPEDFKKMMNDRLPRIIHNMNIGACTSVWNLDNLKVKIGNDRMVIVHEAADSHMDFQDKNFKYTEKLFSRFVTEINEGSMQYLRSLSSDNPSGKPANFWADYPDLAADFELPPELNLIMENMHSSVLRVSGPVNMWLHYDVMANVLCQIHGTKRLILYPPSDISLFSIPAGASSASKPPRLAGHHPYEVLLRPGDVLFIPPLWLHTASPVDKVSISINVFFRDLDSGYAAGRDVYGNRDLQAYEKGRKELEKIAKSFERLPPEVGRFYMERLANELKDKAIRTKT
ncbi:tRNA methyltransferase ppm2 [Puttea exsequens]|nr:tRNA methyltransferase ppm2 [Puttea exsequens]